MCYCCFRILGFSSGRSWGRRLLDTLRRWVNPEPRPRPRERRTFWAFSRTQPGSAGRDSPQAASTSRRSKLTRALAAAVAFGNRLRPAEEAQGPDADVQADLRSTASAAAPTPIPPKALLVAARCFRLLCLDVHLPAPPRAEDAVPLEPDGEERAPGAEDAALWGPRPAPLGEEPAPPAAAARDPAHEADLRLEDVSSSPSQTDSLVPVSEDGEAQGRPADLDLFVLSDADSLPAEEDAGSPRRKAFRQQEVSLTAAYEENPLPPVSNV